jgi:hypothetical protein
MNKKLLESVMKSFILRLEKTEKFVLAEAPEICKQMVTNKIIRNAEQLFCGATLLAIGILLLTIALRNQCVEADGPTRYFFVMLIGGLGALAGFFVTTSAVTEIVYLKNCPKLFLLNEFKDFVQPPKKD